MAVNDNQPTNGGDHKPTAAEIAAQALLLDNALIHTLEKTLGAMVEGLAAARVLRDELVKGLADGAEMAALRAENARLQAALDGLPIEGSGDAAPEETAAAEPADEPEPATDAAPIEEAALPTNPTW